MTSPVVWLINVALVLLFVVHSGQCTPFKRCKSMMRDEDVFDWRQKGVIAPVSDQGQMGSAAAIAIAECVESLLAIELQEPVVVLSRQEVDDCCDDQRQPKFPGFECITYIGGLCTETDYNYTGGKCNNASCTPAVKILSTGYIPEGREDIMLQAVHQTPLAAYIDASHTSFQTYTSGIYSDPACSGATLDHVVQVVGYGNSTTGEPYWIVKNSWGVNWGEQGYMRIARGQNMCGIANSAFFPINRC